MSAEPESATPDPVASEAVTHAARLRGAPGRVMRGLLPWATSTVFHAGLIAAGVVVYFAARAAQRSDERAPIIVPTALLDPSGKPGGSLTSGAAQDPARDTAQDRLREVMTSTGTSARQASLDAARLLGAGDGDVVAAAILPGSGGRPVAGGGGAAPAGDGPIAPFGTPAGGSAQGPRSTFYGTSGNATRIVYILDHSGGMLDHLSYLEDEVTRSVVALLPVQQFAVILVSDRARQVRESPDAAAAAHLVRATNENKQQILTRMKTVAPEGFNDGTLAPFEDAFRLAFATRPQLVYFLTDGQFDPRLVQRVAAMNAQLKGSVHINTIAFGRRGGQATMRQLDALARDNGGVFRPLSADEIEK